jgi:predicted nuclease of predicted toxin-antitoxin system
VKLLFDENLSPRLPDILHTEFPGSGHLRNVGLLGADDAGVWDLARRDGFSIVSKDNDFRQRSFLEGARRRIIWLNVGNAGTQDIATLLRREHARILIFEADAESSLLVLAL